MSDIGMIRSGVGEIKDAVTSHELVIEDLGTTFRKGVKSLETAISLTWTASEAMVLAIADFQRASGIEYGGKVESLETAQRAAAAIDLQNMEQDPAKLLLSALARLALMSEELKNAYDHRIAELESPISGTSALDRTQQVNAMLNGELDVLVAAEAHDNDIGTHSTRAVNAAADIIERL
jgi:predicted transcriptional regulator of viral defense system